STPAGATVGALGAITGTAGTAYTFIAANALTCASAASAAVTIPVQLAAPATPTVSFTAATCSADGTASIDNYSAALTYASTPAGATVGALGAITGTPGTAYTFIATNAIFCASNASAAVTIPAQLAAPTAPTVSFTAATCSADGTASIDNYSAALTYASTPAGATVGALGAITGTAGTAYTFIATNALFCASNASAAVTIPAQLAAPTAPTVSTAPATCSADGTASIDNYSAALTYASTPAGATVGALGAITGTLGTAYTFIATNALTCASAASAAVTIPVQLAAPAAPTVSTTVATCSADGTASIDNYSAALTYASTPAGATVGALGAITGTAGTAYTFIATNALTCASAASAAVTIPVQPLPINDGVTLSSGVLTATQTGASYQWYNCSDNSPIGTNNNTFIPTQVGNYKVEITIGSCSVISSCITVNTLGTTDFTKAKKSILYPNPSKGLININTEYDGNLEIIDNLGRTVKTLKVVPNILNSFNVEELGDGIYFIRETKANTFSTLKLIIRK
ncbi:T9SS type A sorting domain-containing protein, partial [Flavobacterium aquicola]